MRRPALILPVVLVLIGLLALTMAGYVFFIRAETAGTVANIDGQQALLAAQSGFEEIIALLRKSRDDAKAWFDDPVHFRNILVYSPEFDRSKDPFAGGRSRKQAFDDGEQLPVAWRWAAVGMNYDAQAKTIRYGITPETSKLNLNSATDEQIQQLLEPLLLALRVENAQEIINAILDWRDNDDIPREGGAENAYYNTLTPPYNCKNGPFTTIEELLLVKGVNAAILYGEDVNRNGLLDPNEDDSDATFPYYDNGDGVLNHGIASFLTVWTREPDTALDNKPRINLSGDPTAIQTQIKTLFTQGELSDATIAFILQVKQQGVTLRSPADLIAGSGTDQAGQQNGGQQNGNQQTGGQPTGNGQNGGAQTGGQSNGTTGSQTPGGSKSGSTPQTPGGSKNGGTGGTQNGGSKSGSSGTGTQGGGSKTPAVPTNGTSGDKKGGKSGGKKAVQKVRLVAQVKNDGNPDNQTKSGGDDDNIAAEQNPQGHGQDDGKDGRGGDPVVENKGDGNGEEGQQDQGQEQAPPPPGGIQDSRLLSSPVTPDEMPYIMDRFTTVNPQSAQNGLVGLININTAPVEVLKLLPGMTAESAAALVAARQRLDGPALRTTAWPIVQQVLDVDTWQRIAPFITTKAYQFHIEVVGYGDHTKIARRMEWIVEMLGPLPQVRYERDLTSLGLGWPIDDDTVTVRR